MSTDSIVPPSTGCRPQGEGSPAPHGDVLSSDSDINTGGRVECFCWACGRNTCTLALSLCLFSCITAAQTVGAVVAGSMALLADCGSMALDTCAYGVNLAAECRPDPDKDRRRRNTLIASGISYLILLLISSYFFITGLMTLWAPAAGGASVNPYIVLGFACAGIVVDVVSLVPYITAMKNAGTTARLNLSSAVSHVGADLLRSTSTLIESIVLLETDLDPNKVDAVTVLVVTVSILAGMCVPVLKWIMAVNEYRASRMGLPTSGALAVPDRIGGSVSSLNDNPYSVAAPPAVGKDPAAFSDAAAPAQALPAPAVLMHAQAQRSPRTADV
eukprot:TRINITY_DN20434_c0_g1_i1.p1 TRINITY_DN20434_c0_g1~~TRINITY_DN20434_c0_g1_i1.p1  ORF type:complete len:330 (+),score=96.57 TRINITY_DN20434_c0_g1_i1:109-1098(+)